MEIIKKSQKKIDKIEKKLDDMENSNKKWNVSRFYFFFTIPIWDNFDEKLEAIFKIVKIILKIPLFYIFVEH